MVHWVFRYINLRQTVQPLLCNLATPDILSHSPPPNFTRENVLFQTYSSRQWLRGLKLFCSRQHFSSHSVPDNSFPDKIIMSLCSRHQAYHGLSQKYCLRYLFSRQSVKVGILPDNKIKEGFRSKFYQPFAKQPALNDAYPKITLQIKPNRQL